MESREIVLMNLIEGQRRRHIENRLMIRGWEMEEREGGMHAESNVETHISLCKIDSQWGFAV